MTQPAPLLTPGQVVEKFAAAGIEVHEETVRGWARSGKIPTTRTPSGRFFFREADIDAYLQPSGDAA